MKEEIKEEILALMLEGQKFLLYSKGERNAAAGVSGKAGNSAESVGGILGRFLKKTRK